MDRAQKTEFIEELTVRFGRAPIVIVTDYRGLNVAQITELRAKVREADGEYLVTKNTLSRIAIKETGSSGIEEMLTGPNAIAFGYGDPIGIAKAVQEFAKGHEALEIKGGSLEGEALSGADVERLAKMPGRDELRAQLLALLMTPATSLVRLLNAPAQQMVQVLHARSQQAGGE
ncbi:MAG: 50S ribosomal protein L10 [Myxococcales bacterium]|nr:MAG: 50S ribosomal protein L10 [Myxococcales bacterium]